MSGSVSMIVWTFAKPTATPWLCVRRNPKAEVYLSLHCLLFVHVDPMDKDTMDDVDVVARVLHCFDVNVSLDSNLTVVE